MFIFHTVKWKIECNFKQKTWTRGQCYQNYICELLTILVNRIFIAMWIYKKKICKLFFTKDFFPLFANYVRKFDNTGPRTRFKMKFCYLLMNLYIPSELMLIFFVRHFLFDIFCISFHHSMHHSDGNCVECQSLPQSK